MVDFKSLKRPANGKKPIDPEEIFRRLPRLTSTPNDLWVGQAEALRQWHANRRDRDVLISLNTGAGKTLVGLLIAQSLVNEGTENVIYCCSTIDLVNQTSREASRLGIKHTTRTYGKFSDDLFESGKGFLITTYQSLFHGFSIFVRKFPPGAVVWDDAHVSEQLLRDAFTILIEKEKYPAVYQKLGSLFTPAFKSAGKQELFRDIVSAKLERLQVAPPGAAQRMVEEIVSILRDAGLPDDDKIKFRWPHIQDHIACCAFTFGKNAIEIAPPFVPAKALSYFQRVDIRRIYMSATLTFRSDFVRAFGVKDATEISPASDAGQGERLILFTSQFPDGEASPELVEALTRKFKVLIAVPTYARAEKWNRFAKPPSVENFSEQLETFRQSKEPGGFVMVSRFDGIDLPHDTCRVMLIDGLPATATQLERFSWHFAGMQTALAGKMANRVTQLMGRINRGRNDFGVVLISSRDLITWMKRDKNIALFPDLLRKQIVLGNFVQDELGINGVSEYRDAISKVIGRDQGWLDYYSEAIANREVDPNEQSRAEETEKVMTEVAFAESEFGRLCWEGDTKGARRSLEEVIERIAYVDQRLAGWYNCWIGMCYEIEGDPEAAQEEYDRAKARFGASIAVELLRAPESVAAKLRTTEAHALFLRAAKKGDTRFTKELRTLESAFDPLAAGTATPFQAEDALRRLGEFLGYDSTRPDNELGIGPDVLWRDAPAKLGLCFELKTDKNEPAKYTKEDIGQGFNHLEWMKTAHSDCRALGLVFVGPPGAPTPQSNPNSQMYLCETATFVSLAQKVIAFLREVRKEVPLGRPARCDEFIDRERLTLPQILDAIGASKLTDI